MDQKDGQKSKGKKISVDKAKCIGCGICVSTCPDVFELSDEDQKSHVKNASACAECNCQEALDNCPTKAISWEESK